MHEDQPIHYFWCNFSGFDMVARILILSQIQRAYLGKLRLLIMHREHLLNTLTKSLEKPDWSITQWNFYDFGHSIKVPTKTIAFVVGCCVYSYIHVSFEMQSVFPNIFYHIWEKIITIGTEDDSAIPNPKITTIIVDYSIFMTLQHFTIL